MTLPLRVFTEPQEGASYEQLRALARTAEEQLQIITGLWETPVGQTFAFNGKHYSLTDSPALPKPVQQPRPPVVMGGWGSKRTPRLAVEFADEFNVPFPPLDAFVTQIGHVREACERAGRDPATLVLSAALVV